VINDKRSRNLKYICEFTKFKLIDNEKTITCIQNLIDDLKGYNIELLIFALESVGRYLYLSPLSANKYFSCHLGLLSFSANYKTSSNKNPSLFLPPLNS